MDCDVCEYFLGYLSIGHFVRSAFGWSEDGEGLFDVMADIFISI